MAPRVSVFIAASLDGYIARADGGLDWLPAGAGGEDYGYRQFMETVDVLVMGRRTFEKVLTFGSWPYDRPVVVLSRRGVDVPADLAEAVEVWALPPGEVVRRLAGRGVRHVYLDGGQTIQRFLRAGLVDQIILTRIPVLLGDGVPLFGALHRDVHLQHVDTRVFKDGLVQSRYRVLDVES